MFSSLWLFSTFIPMFSPLQAISTNSTTHSLPSRQRHTTANRTERSYFYVYSTVNDIFKWFVWFHARQYPTLAQKFGRTATQSGSFCGLVLVQNKRTAEIRCRDGIQRSSMPFMALRTAHDWYYGRCFWHMFKQQEQIPSKHYPNIRRNCYAALQRGSFTPPAYLQAC